MKIKPTGLLNRDLVDALYMIISSIKGICTKLDADGGVPETDYLALCYTAIFNVKITDSLNRTTGQWLKEKNFYSLSQIGFSDPGVLEAMYQIALSIETLTEKLDADALTFTNYEATSYTAVFTQMFENQEGSIIGNGNAFYFRPGGVWNQKELVEFLYNAIEGINLICADNTTTGLDGDGTVTDTDYNALWYTANITIQVENGAGNTIGN